MEFEDSLRKAGLTGNESKVYIELLQKGQLSANDIAKKIGMDRTLTYTVLNHLLEKGMISYTFKDGRKAFEAANPENLLNPVKETEVFIRDLIPKLQKIEKIIDTPYEINVYEGKDGLRDLLKLIMKHKQLLSFGATGRAYDAFYEVPALVKEIAKKGFKAKIITAPKFKFHEMTWVGWVETKYLDIKSEATTSIFGDYVSIHLAIQKPRIIVIKNKEIAESYRNHFQVLWASANS